MMKLKYFIFMEDRLSRLLSNKQLGLMVCSNLIKCSGFNFLLLRMSKTTDLSQSLRFFLFFHMAALLCNISTIRVLKHLPIKFPQKKVNDTTTPTFRVCAANWSSKTGSNTPMDLTTTACRNAITHIATTVYFCWLSG